MANFGGFNFTVLWDQARILNISQTYIKYDSNYNILGVKLDGCLAKFDAGFNKYDQRDVYERAILWRLPLIALWATTTIPAFRFHTWVFTLVHLIADPIDTVWSLLYKLDLAQRTARWARNNDNSRFSFTFDSEVVGNDDAARVMAARTGEDAANTIARRTALINEVLGEELSPLPAYFHDIIASIVTAYDEWDYGDQAIHAMNYAFNSRRWDAAQRTAFRKRCAKAAFFITADRVSRFLPTVVAALVFCVQISAGFWKTLSALGDSYDGSNPVSAGLNRAPHNIAFGVLFFWLPLLVLLTALVGSSQTSHMVPRVLDEFRRDYMLSYQQLDRQGRRPTEIGGFGFAGMANQHSPHRAAGRVEDRHFPDIFPEKDKRWNYGGLPVWQGSKFRDLRKAAKGEPSHRSFASVAISLSLIIVAVPTASAVSLSWRTPGEGFDCRTLTQLSFFVVWTVNALSDWVLFTWAESQQVGRFRNKSQVTIYWITFVKDFVLAAATIIFLTLSAIGIFNRCECWCKWSGERYIYFPQNDQVFKQIRDRLAKEFPIIVCVTLGVQILAFVAIRVYFHEGCQVLRQRDIDSVLESRNSLWSRLRKWFRGHRTLRRVPTMQMMENLRDPITTHGDISVMPPERPLLSTGRDL